MRYSFTPILLMKKTVHAILLAVGLFAPATTHAAINIPTVSVVNAGNAADSTSYGAVDYNYHIGTYPVTNTQYMVFLNSEAASDPHGLYHSDMSSSIHGGIERAGAAGSYTYSVKQGYEKKPVNFVSFWDAARFTNWLTTGDTESGVYVLTSSGITNNTVTRDATAWANGGVAITSLNEWYKAAYYDATLNSGSGGYWLYPIRSNSITTADANFYNGAGSVTDVDLYDHVPSYYNTFDQSANVAEWNEEIITGNGRGVRAGAYNFGPSTPRFRG